jgi:DNA gyrase subunit B
VNEYAETNALLRNKVKLEGTDIREGLTAIVSLKIPEGKLEFEGQTKGKLGTPDALSAVQNMIYSKLTYHLVENKDFATNLIKKCVDSQAARMAARKAKEEARGNKKFRSDTLLSDKLTPAQSKDYLLNELFIVEGDSAGGTAVDARDPRTQAILPIRGKILNVERARLDKMLKNTEIQALITAIGGGVGDEFDVTKARYHKIIALADADVDGSHIRTLLLTFFYRQMKPMVEAGYVYIAQPPLFSTEVGKEKVYLKDEAAKNAFLEERPNHKKEFQRLKGLGEMDWEELKSTTMDSMTRTLLQVTVEEAAIADEVVSVLMGDDVESRKKFITTNARDVRNLDF